MSALSDWLDALPRMLTTTAAGNLRTYRALGGSNAKPGTDRPRLIVIHTMQAPEDDRARSTARWVQAGGGTSKVSCHFCVDNDEAIRCVEDPHVGFTQLTPWNDMSLSIEQAGYAEQQAPDWQDPYSIGQRSIVAKIVAAWSEKWGIPLQFLTGPELAAAWRTCTGVTTHHEISVASKLPELTSLGYKTGSHWDPGPGYPMAQMLDQARAHLGALPPPLPPPTITPGDSDMPARYLRSDGAQFILGPNGNDKVPISPAYSDLLAVDGSRLHGPSPDVDAKLAALLDGGSVRDVGGFISQKIDESTRAVLSATSSGGAGASPAQLADELARRLTA